MADACRAFQYNASSCTLLGGSREVINTNRLVLVIGLVLAVANPSRADVGVIVLEPIEALGFWTRVGHAATYLSNICPDGSPIRMRMCRWGERGGVVSKYTPISAHEDYDWAIVPFEQWEFRQAVELVNPCCQTPLHHHLVRSLSLVRFDSRRV